MENMSELTVLNAIKSVLGDECTYNMPYRNAIEIMGPYGTDTRFWIRLSRSKNSKLAVDFSNIQLDNTIRGKGLFRKVVEQVIKLNCIEYIQVSSVITPEMHRACSALNMDYIAYTQSYRINPLQWKIRRNPNYIPTLNTNLIVDAMKFPSNILSAEGIDRSSTEFNIETFKSIYLYKYAINHAVTTQEKKSMLISLLSNYHLSELDRNIIKFLLRDDVIGRVVVNKDNSYFNFVIMFCGNGNTLNTMMLSRCDYCKIMADNITYNPMLVDKCLSDYLKIADNIHIFIA